jgi:hypothetical protein
MIGRWFSAVKMLLAVPKQQLNIVMQSGPGMVEGYICVVEISLP